MKANASQTTKKRFIGKRRAFGKGLSESAGYRKRFIGKREAQSKGVLGIMERTELIRTIGKLFSLPGELSEATPLTVGNINETYTVTYREADGSEKQYIFQRLNTNVFTEPERVMENIEHVTEYLRKEYPEECSVHFYHTAEGLNYAFSGANSVYRVMDRIDGVNISKTDDLSLVRACGKGFGAFQSRLSRLDASLLYETIPNFHYTGKRYEAFSEAVREDKVGRLSGVR